MDETKPERTPRSFARTTRFAVSCALMLFVGFTAGTFVADGTTNAFSSIPLLGDGLDATPAPDANLAAFWKAWNALDAKFVQTNASTTAPETDDKIWNAIAGLAASYGDPYTVFMPPQEAKVFQEDISGNFSGVGMEIGVKDSVLTVIAPLKGTPAERAGIRSGDQVLLIDETSTEGLSSDQAVKLIRGPKGTTVKFKMLREGELLDISVVRDTIEVPTLTNNLNNETGIYTIALYTFTANSGDLFSKALKDYNTSGADKLIIDLRGNPGGYLEASVSMASHFLPEGTTVVTEDYKGKRENVVHRTSGMQNVPNSAKIAILIDQGSASASEILAGALQDEGRATLIGTRSFGKGSVQELVEIDGGALKVTVARWLTPSGRSISDGGLTPDILVERTRADFDAGKDPQMERAIQYLVAGN